MRNDEKNSMHTAEGPEGKENRAETMCGVIR